MADSAKITEALKQLDASNDDHWTQSKEPAVAAVSELVGESVSRDEISSAAEGFTRDTAPGYFMNAGGDATAKPWEQGGGSDANSQDSGPVDPAEVNPQQAQAIDMPDQNPGQDAEGNMTGIVKPDAGDLSPEQAKRNVDADGEPTGQPTGTSFRTTEDSPGPPFNPADVAPAPTGSGASGPQVIGDATESPRSDGAAPDNGASGEGGPASSDGETEQSEMEMSSGSSDEIEALEEELRSRNENLAELRLAADKANKAVQDAQGRADAIAERIEQLRPRNSNQATIQDFLASERRRLERRGENRAALAGAGVNIKELQKAVGKAPIDEAMARKNTRGGRRPTRV